jgi:hypothetical protein
MRLVVFSCVTWVERHNLQYSDIMPAALSLRRRSIYGGIFLVINRSLLRGKLPSTSVQSIWSQLCRPRQNSIYPNLPCSLLFLSIQEGQVALPKNGEYPREHESVLGHDKSKAEGCDSRPQFERVFDANRNGFLDPVDDAGRLLSCEDCLHSEEIGVEDGCKYGLLDGHFGRD